MKRSGSLLAGWCVEQLERGIEGGKGNGESNCGDNRPKSGKAKKRWGRTPGRPGHVGASKEGWNRTSLAGVLVSLGVNGRKPEAGSRGAGPCLASGGGQKVAGIMVEIGLVGAGCLGLPVR